MSEHQSREHSVRCSQCMNQQTWHHDAICDICKKINEWPVYVHKLSNGWRLTRTLCRLDKFKMSAGSTVSQNMNEVTCSECLTVYERATRHAHINVDAKIDRMRRGCPEWLAGRPCLSCDHKHCGWCDECHPEVPEWTT